jgi:serine/threonine protein kinase
MTIAAGTKLGTYEVLAQIGAGGMGEVYQAHDTKLGREGLRGEQGRPGDISAAVANAEREARTVVREELAKVKAELLAELAAKN